jgi:hypothetical protein
VALARCDEEARSVGSNVLVFLDGQLKTHCARLVRAFTDPRVHTERKSEALVSPLDPLVDLAEPGLILRRTRLMVSAAVWCAQETGILESTGGVAF